MSPDEVFVTAVAIAVGPFLWAVWLRGLARPEMPAQDGSSRHRSAIDLGALLHFANLDLLISDCCDVLELLWVVLGEYEVHSSRAERVAHSLRTRDSLHHCGIAPACPPTCATMIPCGQSLFRSTGIASTPGVSSATP